MSRIRPIKPEWLQDERLVLASSDARVLSVALILLADDYGNGRANPIVLGATVFPGAQNSREAFTRAAEELVSIRYVRFYELDGQRYFTIRNWAKHQRVDHPSAPKVPAPPPELDDAEMTTRHTADGPGVDGSATATNSENLSDTAASPGPSERAGTRAATVQNGSTQETSRVSRETLARHSGKSRPSRDPFPSSDLSLLSKLSGDQPEKPGSARARSKQPARPAAQAQDRVPRPLANDWQPDPEQVAALAAKHGVTEARIRANVPEFVWFWRKNGRKSTARGWAQAFGNRIDMLAKNEQLYIQRPGESAPEQQRPDDAEARRKRAAEVEARARAQRDAKARQAAAGGAQ